MNCILEPFRGLNVTRQTASGSKSNMSQRVTIHHMVNNRQAPVSRGCQQLRGKGGWEGHTEEGHTCGCVGGDTDDCQDNKAVLLR